MIRPENTAVLYRTEVTMKCSTNSTAKLMWRAQWNRTEGPKTIYTGNKLAVNMSSIYNISSKEEGHVDLVTRANETTARTYICEESEIKPEESASAELIALGNSLLFLSFHIELPFSFVHLR